MGHRRGAIAPPRPPQDPYPTPPWGSGCRHIQAARRAAGKSNWMRFPERAPPTLRQAILILPLFLVWGNPIPMALFSLKWHYGHSALNSTAFHSCGRPKAPC